MSKFWISALAACAMAGACSERELVSETAPRPVATAAGPEAAPAPDVSGLPAGSYKVDPSHASMVFRVNHLGFSTYTAQFRTFEAALDIDPANPAAASVTASVDAASLLLPTPPAGFQEEMLGATWFNVASFPTIDFRSTGVTLTGPATAKIAGELTMLGVTKPIVLDAKFNGGWAGIPPDPFARIGFSMKGVVKRSEYGMTYGVPTPPDTMGVGDDVHVDIEVEMIGPPWAGAAALPQ